MKHLNSQKGIVPIILILILVAVAAAGVGGAQYFKKQQAKQVAKSTVADATANWKTYSSLRCNFSIKAPPDWNVRDAKLVPGTNDPNYHYGCIDILAPDYKISGDSSVGLGINISRTSPGAKFKTVTINSIDDYIEAAQSIVGSSKTTKNVQAQSIGDKSGKYYEFGAMENISNFVFMTNNYIYEASWIQGYAGNYKQNVDQILSTFKFIDQQSPSQATTDAFLKAYRAKYPQPNTQPIPSGLEDQLFTAYNKDLIQSGKKAVERYNFSLERYYGDVAEGEIGNATEPNGFGGGSTWTMNKNNGNWIVIFFGRQELPMCNDVQFQSVINELKDWQGSCYTKINEYPYSRLIDGKHPNESYNNY